MRFCARVAKDLFQPPCSHSIVFVERSGIDPPVILVLYSQTVCGKNCLEQLQNGDSQPDVLVLIAY